MTVSSFPSPVERRLGCERLGFVGSDIYIECAIAAHKMGEHLKGAGEVATVGVIDSHNAEASIKTRIFVSQLVRHYPGIKVVASKGAAKYDIKNRSREITLALLEEFPHLAGIYTNADETVRGIVEATDQLNRLGVCTVCYGNEPHIMEYLQSRKITYALLHKRFVYGFNAMVLLYNRLVNGDVPAPRRVLHNPDVVCRDTLYEFWSPDGGYRLSEDSRRMLIAPVKQKPVNPLRFVLQLEGQGVWFEQVIKGAMEAEKILPLTELQVENWRISGMDDTEIEQERIRRLENAAVNGAHGVITWVLNETMIPHINEAVRGGTEVVVFHTEPVSYEAITPEVDEVFASLFRQMILRDEAEQRLRKISFVDELTGLFNRRRFDQLLGEEVRAAKQSGEPLGLLMIDVDYFKKFNDSYGHLEGDRCLKHVARLLQQHVRRSGDVAARFGGEEFVVILPGNELEQAAMIGQEICAQVADAPVCLRNSSPVQVTVSVGVAVMENSETKDAGRRLLARADQALYRAKTQGRNRVALS